MPPDAPENEKDPRQRVPSKSKSDTSKYNLELADVQRLTRELVQFRRRMAAALELKRLGHPRKPPGSDLLPAVPAVKRLGHPRKPPAEWLLPPLPAWYQKRLDEFPKHLGHPRKPPSSDLVPDSHVPGEPPEPGVPLSACSGIYARSEYWIGELSEISGHELAGYDTDRLTIEVVPDLADANEMWEYYEQLWDEELATMEMSPNQFRATRTIMRNALSSRSDLYYVLPMAEFLGAGGYDVDPYRIANTAYDTLHDDRIMEMAFIEYLESKYVRK